MDLKSLKPLLIPVCVVLALLWVLNRPISAFGLFMYRFSGSAFNYVFEHLRETQRQAIDLLDAKNRVKDLQATNKKLIIENNLLKSNTKEVASLNHALEFRDNFQYKTVPAKIIGRSPDTWHKQIIINKGSKHGVKVGQGVITEKGVVGQVQKTGLYSSVVQLVNNPDWRMGVKIARLNQYGVLSGNYPKPALVQFITVDTDIQPGDEIVTSGICIDVDNCPYPENYPVAKVASVSRNPNVVDLIIQVKFFENLNNIEEVFILH